VKLSPVFLESTLPTNLASLYRGLPEARDTLLAEAGLSHEGKDEVKDEVSTAQAAGDASHAIEAEPEFFEYPVEAAPAVAEASAPAAAAPAETTEAQKVDALSEFEDYQRLRQQALQESATPAPAAQAVPITDLVSFDYSRAKADAEAAPRVAVNTQTSPAPSRPAARPARQQMTTQTRAPAPEKSNNAFLDIQAIGTDLKRAEVLHGFEVRYRDNEGESQADYGSGLVKTSARIAARATNRSLSLLKHGFVPTNSDVALEQGAVKASVPMLEQETFNRLTAPFEAHGPMGAVLVELDDETDVAQLDIPFGDVKLLDGELRATKKENHRYQLFLGVQAGNALLTYKTFKGETVSKLIHVHAGELTFEANIFEPAGPGIVQVYEEDLLAREMLPLITSASRVKIMNTELTASKLNDHTYKLNFERGLFGARRYLELSHLSEPVFVGFRNNTQIHLPSENFMRHILAGVEGGGAGRCLVQLNLSRRISGVDVGAEAIDQGLATFVQMLDSDGRFYDSASEKTRKVIIVGEKQSSEKFKADARINIKVNFTDGSSEFVTSYCAPNTYLVEQL
jgi:hypothetical protein